MNYVFLSCGMAVSLAALIYLEQLLGSSIWAWQLLVIPTVAVLSGFSADPEKISAILPPMLKIGSVKISLKHPFGLTGFLFVWEKPSFASRVGKTLTLAVKYMIFGLLPVLIFFYCCR